MATPSGIRGGPAALPPSVDMGALLDEAQRARQAKMFPGAFGVMDLTPEQKALMEKAVDAQQDRMARERDLPPTQTASPTSIPTSGDPEKLRQTVSPTTVPTSERPVAKTDSISPGPRDPEQVFRAAVAASTPEEKKDPNWLAQTWDKVANFFSGPDAADDVTFWDVLEGGLRGFEGRGIATGRQERMALAREDKLRSEAEALKARELAEARGFQSREAELDRAAALERARLAAVGEAAGGTTLTPEQILGLRDMLLKKSEQDGVVIGAGQQVGGATPGTTPPVDAEAASRAAVRNLYQSTFGNIGDYITGALTKPGFNLFTGK